MRKLLLFALFSFSIFATSCKGPDTISLIGLDESGKEVDLGVDRVIYQKALTNYVSELNLATMDALEANTSPVWSLTKVEIGLSVTASLSAGPLWKWSFSAGQRIVYTKN